MNYLLIAYRVCKQRKKRTLKKYGSGTYDTEQKAVEYITDYYDSKDMEFHLYDLTKSKPRILKRKVLVE